MSNDTDPLAEETTDTLAGVIEHLLRRLAAVEARLDRLEGGGA